MRAVLLLVLLTLASGCVSTATGVTGTERGMLAAAYNNCPAGVACERGGRTVAEVQVPGRDVFIAQTWSSHGSRTPVIVVPEYKTEHHYYHYRRDRYIRPPYNGYAYGCYGRFRKEHGEWVWKCW